MSFAVNDSLQASITASHIVHTTPIDKIWDVIVPMDEMEILHVVYVTKLGLNVGLQNGRGGSAAWVKESLRYRVDSSALIS